MPQALELTLTPAEEGKLRNLAYALAKGIEDPHEVLRRLNLTKEDYATLSESHVFKAILEQAVNEWQGASNTQKRVKLKAAVNIEEALPAFYNAMTNIKEPLAARVKAFEVMARVAGLGNPEPVAGGGGQSFRLEINLGGGRQLTVSNAKVIEGAAVQGVVEEEEAPVDEALVGGGEGVGEEVGEVAIEVDALDQMYESIMPVLEEASDDDEWSGGLTTES